MKRAAIVISVLAVITVIIFIALGNDNLASGSAAGEASQANAGTAQQNPQAPGGMQAAPTVDVSSINSSGVVIAEGRLIPIRYVDLGFNNSGLVAEVYVNEGDIVKAGDLLAVLSNQEQYQATVATAELELVNSQQELKALYDNAPLEAANALQDIVNAPEDVRKAERQLAGLQSGVVNTTDVDIARANLVFAEKKLEDARKAYQPYANRSEDNLTRAALLSRVAEAEKDYQEALRRYNALTGGASDVRVSQAEAELILAQARLADAERRYEILKNGPDPDQVELAQARIANAEAQLAAAQANLASLELRAPFDGTVAKLDMKEGQYIAPGMEVVRLVDFSDWLVETTDLNELNIVKVKVGSPAMIKFDALPELEFIGRVLQISSQGENTQGDITYRVLLELAEYDERLLWNMTSSVEIGNGE